MNHEIDKLVAVIEAICGNLTETRGPTNNELTLWNQAYWTTIQRPENAQALNWIRGIYWSANCMNPLGLEAALEMWLKLTKGN